MDAGASDHAARPGNSGLLRQAYLMHAHRSEANASIAESDKCLCSRNLRRSSLRFKDVTPRPLRRTRDCEKRPFGVVTLYDAKPEMWPFVWRDRSSRLRSIRAPVGGGGRTTLATYVVTPRTKPRITITTPDPYGRYITSGSSGFKRHPGL